MAEPLALPFESASGGEPETVQINSNPAASGNGRRQDRPRRADRPLRVGPTGRPSPRTGPLRQDATGELSAVSMHDSSAAESGPGRADREMPLPGDYLYGEPD